MRRGMAAPPVSGCSQVTGRRWRAGPLRILAWMVRMNKPFDAAEIIRAVGIRLEESRQSIATEKDRIEREIGLQFKAAVADLHQREAEREANIARMDQALAARLAELRNGQDGKDGVDGQSGANGADGAPGPPG